MKVRLPVPSDSYDRQRMAEAFRKIEQALEQTQGKRENVVLDGVDVIMTSPNGSHFSLEVDDSGNLSTSNVTL